MSKVQCISRSIPGFVSGSDERVTVALEELQDLKGVWVELSKIWEQIEELREKPWLSVAPRKIRQALDALLGQLKAFPARLKQYASFEYVQSGLGLNSEVFNMHFQTLSDRMFCAKKMIYMYLHVHVAPIKVVCWAHILVFVFFSQGESVELFLTQLKMCIHM